MPWLVTEHKGCVTDVVVYTGSALLQCMKAVHLMFWCILNYLCSDHESYVPRVAKQHVISCILGQATLCTSVL
jgi:hypothetical protein